MRLARLAASMGFATGIGVAICAGFGARAAHAANAAPDTPMVSNGVESVCTGVGTAKDDPKWDAYPVKVVFSNGAQEFVAGEHVVLKRGGQTLVEMDCAGPWVLFKVPAGRYTVAAWLEGQADNTYSADFSTDGLDARQQRLDISFSAPRKDQTTMPQDTSK
jgi:hypothetical protein